MRFTLSPQSIAAYTARPQNNYLLLRFVAALMVIYGHSYALADTQDRRDLVSRILPFTYSGDLGVYIFFVISGFLVTASYLNRASFADYLKCRVLRIVPGLGLCLALTVFVLGPLVSSLAPTAYFSSHDPYAYFTGNLSLVKTVYALPGVFLGSPQPGAVNGSLWTLPAEFRLYLVIGLIGVCGILSRRRWFLLLALGLAAVVLFAPPDMSLMFNKFPFRTLFLYFLAGSVMRVYADRIPLSGIALAVMAALSLALYRTPAFHWLLGATLAYGTLWIAYVPNLHWFNRAGDYSYGLYIYAFPVGQTLRQYFEHIQPLQLFACTSVLTLICAVFSWHVVEQPALGLKRVRFRQTLWRLLRRRPAAETSE
jgi:peptidoglycan/LPS O-acetylase OafA/YrhL